MGFFINEASNNHVYTFSQNYTMHVSKLCLTVSDVTFRDSKSFKNVAVYITHWHKAAKV